MFNRLSCSRVFLIIQRFSSSSSSSISVAALDLTRGDSARRGSGVERNEMEEKIEGQGISGGKRLDLRSLDWCKWWCRARVLAEQINGVATKLPPPPPPPAWGAGVLTRLTKIITHYERLAWPRTDPASLTMEITCAANTIFFRRPPLSLSLS